MPAEWERHEGTWFSWPHNRDTWPDGLEDAERALAGAVRRIAEGETVHLNVLDERHRRRVHDHVGDSDGVEYHLIPTNDAWCRDHGATIVMDQRGARHAVDWGYNAWGGKYPPYDLDRRVARGMADALGVPVLKSNWTMEGGGLESNGAGTLMTTASCMLNPNRNPGRTQAEAEAELGRLLGAKHVVWLDGELAGDDTDGHIDNLARFVSADTVVVPSAPSDAHHEAMFDRLADEIASVRMDGGNSLHVVRLPHPEPVNWAGNRLPASYANFYIANAAVLVPVYRCDADAEAVRVLSRCFPGREVVGIDCVEIVRGLGAIHCLSQTIF
ncbi:MAG: agmatine deiminase family protein [Rhodothermales bacterium]|nr:agmatine deiminase family protein [Rhodothermales bacterium]